MTDSITLTREELEREMLEWLKDEAPRFWSRQFTLAVRDRAAKSLIATLFTNAKAREEADKEEASRKVVRDIPGPSLIQSTDTHRGELGT